MREEREREAYQYCFLLTGGMGHFGSLYRVNNFIVINAPLLFTISEVAITAPAYFHPLTGPLLHSSPSLHSVEKKTYYSFQYLHITRHPVSCHNANIIIIIFS